MLPTFEQFNFYEKFFHSDYFWDYSFTKKNKHTKTKCLLSLFLNTFLSNGTWKHKINLA